MIFKGATTYHSNVPVQSKRTAKSAKPSSSSAAVLRQRQFQIENGQFKFKQAEMLMKVERKSQNSEAISSYCD